MCLIQIYFHVVLSLFITTTSICYNDALQGPKHLVSPRSIAHQWITFSVAAPLQLALSNIIKQAQENGYFDELANDYTRKRDALYTGLYKAGLNPILSSAGYFIVVDGQNLVEKLGLDPNDNDLGKKLAVELSNQVGVTSIPVSEFYSEAGKHHGRTLLRFAYCKQDHVIESGINKLLESDILKQQIRKGIRMYYILYTIYYILLN